MWYFPIHTMSERDAYKLEELCVQELGYQIGPFDTVLLHKELLCIDDGEPTYFFKDTLSPSLKKLLWKYLKGSDEGCVHPMGDDFFNNYDSILKKMLKQSKAPKDIKAKHEKDELKAKNKVLEEAKELIKDTVQTSEALELIDKAIEANKETIKSLSSRK